MLIQCLSIIVQWNCNLCIYLHLSQIFRGTHKYSILHLINTSDLVFHILNLQGATYPHTPEQLPQSVTGLSLGFLNLALLWHRAPVTTPSAPSPAPPTANCSPFGQWFYFALTALQERIFFLEFYQRRVWSMLNRQWANTWRGKEWLWNKYFISSHLVETVTFALVALFQSASSLAVDTAQIPFAYFGFEHGQHLSLIIRDRPLPSALHTGSPFIFPVNLRP